MIHTLVAIVMALVINGASVLSQPVNDPQQVPGVTVVPCEYEDTIPEAGTACYWDAQTRGNGLGRSFMAYSDGSVVYEDN